MTPKCVLHVPRRVAGARLPVEPRLAHQPLEDPAVDVATVVVPNVDDEPLAVERGIEVAGPLRDVTAPHRPQMDVTDVAIALLLDGEAPRVLPFRVAEIRLALLADRCDNYFPLGPVSRFHAQ